MFCEREKSKVLRNITQQNDKSTQEYELVFGRKPEILLDLETDPDIKVSGSFKAYYSLLDKRLRYLQEILQQFRSKQMAMINKD